MMSDIPDWLKTDYDMEDEKAAAAAQEGGTSPHTVSTSQDDLENAAGGTTADGEGAIWSVIVHCMYVCSTVRRVRNRHL